MKKKNSILELKKTGIVELNNKTLVSILGGLDTNDNGGNGNGGGGDGGTTETRPTNDGFSGVLCVDKD